MQRLSIARSLRLALVALTLALAVVAALGTASLYNSRQRYENRLEQTSSLATAAANLAEHCIKKVETLEYPELGMEAIWRIEVVDFPAFIVIDDKGNDFFKELNLG